MPVKNRFPREVYDLEVVKIAQFTVSQGGLVSIGGDGEPKIGQRLLGSDGRYLNVQGLENVDLRSLERKYERAGLYDFSEVVIAQDRVADTQETIDRTFKIHIAPEFKTDFEEKGIGLGYVFTTSTLAFALATNSVIEQPHNSNDVTLGEIVSAPSVAISGTVSLALGLVYIGMKVKKLFHEHQVKNEFKKAVVGAIACENAEACRLELDARKGSTAHRAVAP